MLRFHLVAALTGLALVTFGLQPVAAAGLATTSHPGRIALAADGPGPSDQQLIRRAAGSQLRAAAQARAAAAARPPSVEDLIRSAFQPQGDAAVSWALQIAFCESTNNPNAVNADSNAQGLFQFLPGTWRGTPFAAQSPFDAAANAQAAAWLLATYGTSQWECTA